MTSRGWARERARRPAKPPHRGAAGRRNAQEIRMSRRFAELKDEMSTTAARRRPSRGLP